MNPPGPTGSAPRPARSRLARWAWMTAGWAFVAIGTVGIVLPGLPTTGPMILALACFARGSERLHDWLLHHRIFGPPLRHWQTHRTMPLRAKVLAVAMMVASFIYVYGWSPLPNWGVAGVGVLIAVGIFVVLRIPHRSTRDPAEIRASGTSSP